jgi:hypothetical protein
MTFSDCSDRGEPKKYGVNELLCRYSLDLRCALLHWLPKLALLKTPDL